MKAIIPIKYELIVYWSEVDEAFIVEVPELVGCMADGQSYAEALANAEIIIQEWIETAKMLGSALENGLEVLELLIEDYTARHKSIPTPRIIKKFDFIPA
jgi:predicted RNase H-like HicB family nuclease